MRTDGAYNVDVDVCTNRCELMSIYQQKGNPEIRKHVHRSVLPREKLCEQMVHIMWTSMCVQTDANYFAPNHFVQLVYREQEVADLHAITEAYTNKYVDVNYEGRAYPGVMLTDDAGDVEARCMYRIGNNRFFWPQHQDICWYGEDNILAVMPPLTAVTVRHKQVDVHI